MVLYRYPLRGVPPQMSRSQEGSGQEGFDIVNKSSWRKLQPPGTGADSGKPKRGSLTHTPQQHLTLDHLCLNRKISCHIPVFPVPLEKCFGLGSSCYLIPHLNRAICPCYPCSQCRTSDLITKGPASLMLAICLRAAVLGVGWVVVRGAAWRGRNVFFSQFTSSSSSWLFIIWSGHQSRGGMLCPGASPVPDDNGAIQMPSGLCATFSKLNPGSDRSLQIYSPEPWCCLLLASSHSYFPVLDFLYPVLGVCKHTQAGIILHNAWKTPDTLRCSIRNLFKPLFFLHQPTPSKHTVKKRQRFKDISIWQGRCRIICLFLWIKKKYYYCKFLSAENRGHFLQRKTEYTNILAGFRSLVSWAIWGHSESQGCFTFCSICCLCFHLEHCCLQGSPAHLRNHLDIRPQSWGWARTKARHA